ncbi:hypothetical protein VTK73DRAFT_382 [Phialemonium thermophilum]|uniref:Uncharacterized protein n=1 Tax=Phialemonium thermophilum TaxID=223376 RepID=A0ABR3VVG1_9PEZI
MEDAVPASQASSHFPLEPLSGSVFLELEANRRDELARKGRLRTGCRGLDDYLLLGGFERGCVVGVSAEDDEEDLGLLMGLQTIGQLVVAGDAEDEPSRPRAAIITTLPTGVLIPKLRDVIKAQLPSAQQGSADLTRQVRRLFECISISRIFDFEGLWEVLRELDPLSDDGDDAGLHQATEQPTVATHSVVTNREPHGPHEDRPKMEIQDSEDEEELSLSSPSLPSSPATAAPHSLQLRPQPQAQVTPARTSPAGPSLPSHQRRPQLPDIILVTNVASLLTSLFSRSDRNAAHSMLQLLSSHLRCLTRDPERGGPLVMLLNSTSSPPPPTTGGEEKSAGRPTMTGPDRNRSRGSQTHHPRPLDPTLRSIFNPPPPPPSMLQRASAAHLASNRNKPTFGLVFTQLLDLHLLCTKVPRGVADTLPIQPTSPASRLERRLVWVVEVLLDELGVWEGGANAEGGAVGGIASSTGPEVVPCSKRKARRSREQRWGPVDVVDGVRIVDALLGTRR